MKKTILSKRSISAKNSKLPSFSKLLNLLYMSNSKIKALILQNNSLRTILNFSQISWRREKNSIRDTIKWDKKKERLSKSTTKKQSWLRISLRFSIPLKMRASPYKNILMSNLLKIINWWPKLVNFLSHCTHFSENFITLASNILCFAWMFKFKVSLIRSKLSMTSMMPRYFTILNTKSRLIEIDWMRFWKT